MKLASLNQGRDGVLLVVSRDLRQAVAVPGIAATLQAALDDWADLQAPLQEVYQRLNEGLESEAFAFEQSACASPLPRAYHWADGSAYVNHIELVRKARGAEMPESFWTEPLIYQGGADSFSPPQGPIRVADEAWGIDLEAEVAVITDDVPMGISPAAAATHIQLVLLVNDVSLRNLIPAE
ncbi:MAG: fumarylacetoacetate hydrolase family protein, partial [Pseudomonas sp.]|nr:fumarylacetoacetate hydrolase family protein [Pseudomonas sp.]